jgi:beta-phosphoglucomutase-like phosphatase (HAD superfamily)
MPEVVLFELEDVLFVTGAARGRALAGALGEHGVTLDPTVIDARCGGLPLPDAVHAALVAATIDADETLHDLIALSASRRFLAAAAHGAIAAPGAFTLIERFAGRARLGIVTRASRREAAALMSLASFDHVATFEVTIALEDCVDRKPGAGPYRLALARLSRRLQVAPRRAIAIESGVSGVRSARGAGLHAIEVGQPALCGAEQA